MPDTRPLAGPCPLCGGLIGIPAEPEPVEPLPAIPRVPVAVQNGKTDSGSFAARHPSRIPASPPSTDVKKLHRVRRRQSFFSPAYLLLSLGLLGLLAFTAWKLSIPIREWLSTSPLTRDFVQEKVQPDPATSGAGEGVKSSASSSDQGAWGALKAFLKAESNQRASFTLEGHEEMSAPFARVFGPTGVLAGDLPRAEDFQVSGDRELRSVLGPAWTVYEVDRSTRSGQPLILLAWCETDGGESHLSGRLFLETVEDKLRGFAAQKGDPDAKWEFLARLRPRLNVEQATLADPDAPYVEVLPPVGDDPVGVVRLADGDPIISSFAADQPLPVTILVGRQGEPKSGLKLLAPPKAGWPGGLTEGRSLPGQDAASRNPESPALEVARAFLAAKPAGRLDYVNSRDNAMLLKELEEAYGSAPPAGSVVSQILAQPRTTARAGAVAARVQAPTHDGEGVSVLWLVPFAGSYKVEGQLWAQSYYGWFRNYLKTPVSTPRELRGIVFKMQDAESTGPRKFRFRDVHSESFVELSLPETAEQAASLGNLGADEGRPATLRLRWETGDAPRIVLDEWICWGYRGIDEQAY